jgi:hypothetical protein
VIRPDPKALDSGGYVRWVSASTVRVAGHYLETEWDEHDRVSLWRLRCGDCLAARLERHTVHSSRPRPGLPVDGALRLPAGGGRPEATLVWGMVATDCDHAEPALDLPPVLGRQRPGQPGRVIFRTTVCARTVQADPVLIGGGLWVAVAPGHAWFVCSDAFGVRSRARVSRVPWRGGCIA